MDRELDLLFEDFNLVPDGSTETVGEGKERYVDLIASRSEEPGRFINAEYTPESGVWEGDYVYAGKNGTIIIQPLSGQLGGMLNTPLGDFSGDITVTVRCRAAKAFWLSADGGYLSTTGSSMSMIACIGGYDVDKYPYTDIGENPVMSTPQLYDNDGWQTFTFKFRNEGADNDGYISFFTRNAIEIDWIKITDAATFLAAPVINPVSDFTDEGFTINWQPVRRAFNYYIDLWKSDFLSDEDYAVTYDFEDGNLPAGAVVDGGGVEEGIGKDQSYGVRITKDGEEGAFILPEAPVKLKTMSFTAMFDMDDEDYEPMLLVEGLSEEGWRPLTDLYFDGMVVRSNRYYTINLNKPEVADKYTTLRFYVDELGEGNSVVIDNVVLTGGRPYGLVRVTGDGSMINDPDNDEDPYNFYAFTNDWKDTSYTFTGLDPEKEYYYRVRSHNVFTFNYGAKQHALGVAMPQLDDASDIESTSYTANWKDVAKAQTYTVRNFKAWEADEDMPEAVIFNETFADSKSSGAANQLDAIGNTEECDLNDYTDMPGWRGKNNYIGNQMIGCADYTGYLTTPVLMVDPTRGNYFVYIELSGKPGESVNMTFEKSGQFADLVFESNGRISGIIEVPKTVRGERIKFKADNGFALCAFEVSQNLQKGNIVRVYDSEMTVEAGAQSCTFSGLDADALYTYDVIANYEYEDETVSSEPRDFILVNLADRTSQFLSKVDFDCDEPVEVARYDINGMEVDAAYKGLVIIRYSNGVVRKSFIR